MLMNKDGESHVSYSLVVHYSILNTLSYTFSNHRARGEKNGRGLPFLLGESENRAWRRWSSSRTRLASMIFIADASPPTVDCVAGPRTHTLSMQGFFLVDTDGRHHPLETWQPIEIGERRIFYPFLLTTAESTLILLMKKKRVHGSCGFFDRTNEKMYAACRLQEKSTCLLVICRSQVLGVLLHNNLLPFFGGTEQGGGPNVVRCGLSHTWFSLKSTILAL
jgi:hypothetical protein